MMIRSSRQAMIRIAPSQAEPDSIAIPKACTRRQVYGRLQPLTHSH